MDDEHGNKTKLTPLVPYGGAGDDKIASGNGDDDAFGEEGDDTIWGMHGNDVVDGGAGNDHLRGDGDDYLESGAKNDKWIRRAA